MDFLSQVRDPWRLVEGRTNLVIGEGWKQFSGHVVQVLPNGILVTGFYDTPFSGADAYRSYSDRGNLFFVEGFPFSIAEEDSLGIRQNWMAKQSGTFTYVSVTGASATVHRLVYGKPCDPPQPPQPTAEEVQAEREKQEVKRAESADRVLRYHQELADKGDPYGEYQMGLRYLRGEGVEKDPKKARVFFIKAAAQGQEQASSELEKLAH